MQEEDTFLTLIPPASIRITGGGGHCHPLLELLRPALAVKTPAPQLLRSINDFLLRPKPFLANYTFQKQISSIRITLQMQKHYSIKIREPSGHRNAALLKFLPIYRSNSRALNRKSDKQGTDRRKQNVNGNWLSSRNDNLLSNSNQIGHIAYHKRGHSVSFETKNLKNCLFSSFHLKIRKKSATVFSGYNQKPIIRQNELQAFLAPACISFIEALSSKSYRALHTEGSK